MRKQALCSNVCQPQYRALAYSSGSPACGHFITCGYSPAKKERKHMEETKSRQVTRKGEPMSTFVPRLSKERATAMGSQFLVFRNKTRLRILDLLIRYGGLLCVVEIAEVLNEHSALISGHLAKIGRASCRGRV